MAGRLLTPEQQTVLDENTRIVHDTGLYRGYVNTVNEYADMATYFSKIEHEKAENHRRFAADQARLPFAEAPFIFEGSRSTIGTFILSLHRAQPQDGSIIKQTSARIGSKPIPGELDPDGEKPIGFLHAEFGINAFEIALARVQVQHAVGLPGFNDAPDMLQRLLESPGLEGVEIL